MDGNIYFVALKSEHDIGQARVATPHAMGVTSHV
jgi:hypothetical protein